MYLNGSHIEKPLPDTGDETCDIIPKNLCDHYGPPKDYDPYNLFGFHRSEQAISEAEDTL